MFRSHRFMSVVAVIMLFAVLLGACVAPHRWCCAGRRGARGRTPPPRRDAPIKIGVSMLFDDLWLTTLRDAMTAYAETQPGVELIMVDSKEDVAVQLGQVENFVAQSVDAIRADPGQHRCDRPNDASRH